jgi:hypothetical protein
VFGSSPLLALSDIMHVIAPSPSTPVSAEDDLEEKHFGAEISTPEPLDNAQIELMRKRVLELIVSGASKMNTTSREKELLEMVSSLPYLFVMNSIAKSWFSQGHSTYIGAYAGCHSALHSGTDDTGTLSAA